MTSNFEIKTFKSRLLEESGERIKKVLEKIHGSKPFMEFYMYSDRHQSMDYIQTYFYIILPTKKIGSALDRAKSRVKMEGKITRTINPKTLQFEVSLSVTDKVHPYEGGYASQKIDKSGMIPIDTMRYIVDRLYENGYGDSKDSIIKENGKIKVTVRGPALIPSLLALCEKSLVQYIDDGRISSLQACRCLPIDLAERYFKVGLSC